MLESPLTNENAQYRVDPDGERNASVDKVRDDANAVLSGVLFGPGLRDAIKRELRSLYHPNLGAQYSIAGWVYRKQEKDQTQWTCEVCADHSSTTAELLVISESHGQVKKRAVGELKNGKATIADVNPSRLMEGRVLFVDDLGVAKKTRHEQRRSD